MSIKISKEANKTLNKYPDRIKNKLIQSVVSPIPSSIHHYVGNYPDMFTVKVGEYRIICRKDSGDTIVESCGVRGDVYKRTRRKLGNKIST